MKRATDHRCHELRRKTSIDFFFIVVRIILSKTARPDFKRLEHGGFLVIMAYGE